MKKRLVITLDDLAPDASEALVVSFREAIYYSRRLQLLVRGVGFHRASSRARLLANYMERRRGREGVSDGKETVRDGLLGQNTRGSLRPHQGRSQHAPRNP